MRKSKPSLGKTIADLWVFVSNDIWRVPKHEVKGLKNKGLNLVRTLILATKGFIADKLTTRASALTYTTLLAVVPVAAIIIGVARGFGFQKVIEAQLSDMLPGQTEALNILFNFVQSFLEVTTSGIVLGIGIVFLIIAVWSILQSIDIAINDIFQIKKARSVSRMLTDYLATMFLLPILLILSSGFSVFLNTAIAKNEILSLLSPLVNVIMTLIPYFISWLGFTLLYILIPNTKVKFANAALAGFIAGFAFQAFQYIYISGQIGVSRYNAIYGSFAAIPLFLLWLQLSWTIVLLGAEIAYAAQNVQNFYFEKETKNVSHRYRYFISILIMNILCKRFENEEGPMTVNEISSQYEIPIRLTSRTLGRLLEMHLISETYSIKDKDVPAYQPAVDINKLTIGYFFERMFDHGSENFQLDVDNLYKPQWDALTGIETAAGNKGGDILIKDL
ncbi:MAG: YihY/virulence factor BrkB family protein [Bacteroidales bacterium]|nr:YihY/virulence factor BrkB family protein [Bacteroidales bacterium]